MVCVSEISVKCVQVYIL